MGWHSSVTHTHRCGLLRKQVWVEITVVCLWVCLCIITGHVSCNDGMFCLKMFTQADSLHIRLPTKFTFERTLSCMLSHMHSKVILASKWPFTHFTLIGSFSCMNTDMLSKFSFSECSFSTVIAHMWIFLHMTPFHVFATLWLLVKELLTKFTFVWFFTSVNSSMFSQFNTVWKLCCAIWALKSLFLTLLWVQDLVNSIMCPWAENYFTHCTFCVNFLVISLILRQFYSGLSFFRQLSSVMRTRLAERALIMESFLPINGLAVRWRWF